MGDAEIFLAGLFVAVAGLNVLAQRLAIPYPIVLVLGGLLVGGIPGVARKISASPTDDQ